MLGETISCSHTKDVNFNQCKQFLLHGFIIVTIYLTIDVQYAVARLQKGGGGTSCSSHMIVSYVRRELSLWTIFYWVTYSAGRFGPSSWESCTWIHLFVVHQENFFSWWLHTRKQVSKVARRGFDSPTFLIGWMIWKEQNERTFGGPFTPLLSC